MTLRALCVGINRFANLPRSSWLYGCVNDATDMTTYLAKQPDSVGGSVLTLTDEYASKAGVWDVLTDLADASQTGDRLVFHFSSHGTQVPDTSGDEDDLMDEAFACHDLNQLGDHWDPATLITDDELGALFRGPCDRGVLVEAILDTCHAGTGLRVADLLPGRRPRFLPPPTPAGLADTMGIPAGAREISRWTGPVLYAACRPYQTASDATFDGRPNGAFTHYLLATLHDEPQATRAALMFSVGAYLEDAGFEQAPELTAPRAYRREPFGEG